MRMGKDGEVGMKEMIARVGDALTQSGIGSVCLTGEEIVRCKECTHAEPERIEEEIWCPVTCSLRSMDWFCADGERKHDNG